MLTSRYAITIAFDALGKPECMDAKCQPSPPFTAAPQIVFGQKSGQRLPPAGPHGIQIRTLDEVRAAGEQHPTPHVPPAPDATATLCYTSGTTGVPKGAVLRHSAMVANAVGTMFCFPLETGARAVYRAAFSCRLHACPT